MKVIIFGGDGFCGWPTSLRLSEMGYDVTIIDDLSKRKIVKDLGVDSLTPVRSIETRIETWKTISGKNIKYYKIDIAKDYFELKRQIENIRPDSVVHFAQQPSAAYSMKTPEKKLYTVQRNVSSTNNLLCAIVESGIDIHIVHLGTMGVYGYGTAGMKIPEGYLKIQNNIEIPYPFNPGSIYHMTKCLDAVLFYYYNKNDKLRITDLHQGIVWGTQTPETERHPYLINKFFYDGDMGTVLNRFLMQSAVGHPLTVHGTGGQTRAFIHIRDTVKCVKMAIDNPPEKGERVKIFNQAAQGININDLAMKISQLTGCEIRYYENPRNEDSKNNLGFENYGFRRLGWEPIYLKDGLLTEVRDIAEKYKDRCNIDKIVCTSLWDKNKKVDIHGSLYSK